MVNAELRSAIYVEPRLRFIHRSNIKLLENHSLERKQRRKKGIREKMAQEGQVISCRNLDEWNNGLQDAKESKKLVCLITVYSLCIFLVCYFLFILHFFSSKFWILGFQGVGSYYFVILIQGSCWGWFGSWIDSKSFGHCLDNHMQLY
jgi:hypothetical protein